MDIKISNQVEADIVLMSSDKMPLNGITILKGVTLSFEKQFLMEKTVTLTAKNVVNGQTVYLSGKKELTLNSAPFGEHALTIVASEKSVQTGVPSSFRANPDIPTSSLVLLYFIWYMKLRCILQS